MARGDTAPADNALGKVLVAMRREAHLQQQEMSPLVGRTQSFVSMVEAGLRVPTVWFVASWCRACGTDMIDFGERFEAMIQDWESK